LRESFYKIPFLSRQFVGINSELVGASNGTSNTQNVKKHFLENHKYVKKVVDHFGESLRSKNMWLITSPKVKNKWVIES
jgi:hypothetical protein